MKPLCLRATNYRTFADLELELPAGCVGVVGDNGAGKSTIIGAIDLALFGPESRSLDPYMSDAAIDGETMSLELELEHRGARYRIRRSYTRSGRGKSTTEFAQLLTTETENGHGLTASTARAASWEPLTQGDQKDTQALIEETLGLTRDTFRASAFLAQGDGASFTDAQPRQRKEILADVLGLGVWDSARDLAAADKRDRQQSIAALDGKVALLDEQLVDGDVVAQEVSEWENAVNAAGDNLAGFEADAVRAKDTFEKLTDRSSRAGVVRSGLAAATAEQAALAREQEAALTARSSAETVRTKLAGARARAQNLEPAERDLARLEDARAEQQRRAQERDNLERELQDVTVSWKRSGQARLDANERHRKLLERIDQTKSTPGAHCDRCDQVLTDTARDTALASLEREAGDLDAQCARHERDESDLALTAEQLRERIAKLEPTLPDPAGQQAYEDAAERVRAARSAREEAAALAERLDGLEKTADLRDTFQTELEQAERKVAEAGASLAEIDEPEPGAFEAARAEAIRTANAVTRARAESERAKIALAQARTRLEAVDRARDERASAGVERDRLQADLEELLLLERAFGRDGVPTWILETSAIPQLELHADEMLRAFGTDYRVELRTERAKKSGGTSDTLDVVLLTPTGERDYSTFSGGERTRLNLALRLALARLLAHRRGAECGLLAIDEPEFLDVAGTERLVDALRTLESEYDTILLVSHVPALRDAFDRTIQVTKNEGRSEVTVA